MRASKTGITLYVGIHPFHGTEKVGWFVGVRGPGVIQVLWEPICGPADESAALVQAIDLWEYCRAMRLPDSLLYKASFLSAR